jgi:hypothetical protein
LQRQRRLRHGVLKPLITNICGRKSGIDGISFQIQGLPGLIGFRGSPRPDARSTRGPSQPGFGRVCRVSPGRRVSPGTPWHSTSPAVAPTTTITGTTATATRSALTKWRTVCKTIAIPTCQEVATTVGRCNIVLVVTKKSIAELVVLLVVVLAKVVCSSTSCPCPLMLMCRGATPRWFKRFCVVLFDSRQLS